MFSKYVDFLSVENILHSSRENISAINKNIWAYMVSMVGTICDFPAITVYSIFMCYDDI